MPKIGTSPMSAATLSRAYGTASGSPGPFERKTPSGLSAITSRAGVGAGTTFRLRDQACGIEIERRDHRLLGAVGPQMPHQRAGVDAGDADDAVRRHVGPQALLRSPTAGRIPVLLHDEAGDERPPRLDVD